MSADTIFYLIFFSILALWALKVVVGEQKSAAINELERKAVHLFETAKFVVDGRGTDVGGGRHYADAVVDIRLTHSGGSSDASIRNEIIVTVGGMTVLSGRERYVDIWEEGSCANGWAASVHRATKGPWTSHLNRLQTQIERERKREEKDSERQWQKKRVEQLDL